MFMKDEFQSVYVLWSLSVRPSEKRFLGPWRQAKPSSSGNDRAQLLNAKTNKKQKQHHMTEGRLSVWRGSPSASAHRGCCCCCSGVAEKSLSCPGGRTGAGGIFRNFPPPGGAPLSLPASSVFVTVSVQTDELSPTVANAHRREFQWRYCARHTRKQSRPLSVMQVATGHGFCC